MILKLTYKDTICDTLQQYRLANETLNLSCLCQNSNSSDTLQQYRLANETFKYYKSFRP